MNKQNIITPRCLYDVSFPSPSRDGKKYDLKKIDKAYICFQKIVILQTITYDYG